jgi:hypothetical protein
MLSFFAKKIENKIIKLFSIKIISGLNAYKQAPGISTKSRSADHSIVDYL